MVLRLYVHWQADRLRHVSMVVLTRGWTKSEHSTYTLGCQSAALGVACM